MPKLINSVDLNRMKSIESNKDLINQEYLKDEANKLTGFISDLFFNGKATDPILKAEGKRKIEILNHTIAIPYKIATTKAKFFGKPATNLVVQEVKEQVVSYVYGWFAVFAIDETNEDGKPIINKYNPEQYIKGIDFDSLVTYLKDEQNDTYAFIKEFPNDESGTVRNNLYKITGDISAGVSGKKVNLDALDQTAHLDEVDNFGVNAKLIYTVNDYKLKNTEYGTPQFDMVKGLLNQLNIELVNIKDQFIKHLQAKLAIQGIDAGKMPKDADGNINIRDAEAIFLEHGSSTPEYVQNRNDLLKDAIGIIDNYIGWIATTLSIPKELVWLNGQTGTESSDSKELRYMDFTMDIGEIHDWFREVFAEMFAVVIQIDKSYLKDVEEKAFTYIPEPVMPKNGLTLAQELNTAKTGGFISNYTAVKQYTGFSGKELEEEIARIAEEEAKAITNVDLF